MSTTATQSMAGETSSLQMTPSGTALTTTEPVQVTTPVQDAQTVQRSATIPISDVFARDRLLTRVDISNADSPFVNNLGYFPAFEAYFNDTFVANHAYGYKFYRGDLRVTVNMVIPGSCFGAYLVQALCDGGVRDNAGLDGYSLDDYHTSPQGLFGILNCENQNSVELLLPFIHPYECDTVTPPLNVRPMWRLLIWPLSPLTSTIATTALGQITIFGHLENHTFEVQRFQAKKRKPDAFQESISPPVKERKQGSVGKISAQLGSIATTVATAAPFLAPFAGPIATGMGIVSSIADMFGFTRESSPRMPEPLLQRQISSMATVDGTDPSDIVALLNTNAVSIDPRIGGGTGEDPLSFTSLFERWTIVRTFNINKGTPVGGVYNIPVSPVFPGVTLGRAFHTVAGYCGLPFSFWSGDMEYLIYIPSSPNIKGSLQVFWDPAVFPTTAVSYASDPTVFLSGHMIDLSGTSATYLNVSMAGQNPSKFCEPIYDTGSTRADSFANGSLTFYLNAEVTTTRTDVVNLTVVVLARGGQNMRFHTPKQMTTVGGDSDNLRSVTTSYRLQSLRVFDPTVGETSADLVTSEQEGPVIAVNFGEEIASARALLQKFSFAGQIQLLDQDPAFPVDTPRNFAGMSFPRLSLGVAGSTGYYPAQSAPGFDTNTVAYPWTWAGHYLGMYSGFRGGHRIKLMQRTIVANQVDVTYPVYASALARYDVLKVMNYYASPAVPPPATLAAPFTHLTIQPISRESGGEYEIPYYCPTRFQSPFADTVQTAKGYGDPLNAQSAIGFFWMPTWGLVLDEPGLKKFDVYMAAAPDISVAQFRRVPGLIIAA